MLHLLFTGSFSSAYYIYISSYKEYIFHLTTIPHLCSYFTVLNVCVSSFQFISVRLSSSELHRIYCFGCHQYLPYLINPKVISKSLSDLTSSVLDTDNQSTPKIFSSFPIQNRHFYVFLFYFMNYFFTTLLLIPPYLPNHFLCYTLGLRLWISSLWIFNEYRESGWLALVLWL